MREFGEIKQRNYPRDMEAPIYVALRGRLALEGSGKSKSGLGEFGCAENLVPVAEIATELELPFSLVMDFIERKGITVKKHPYRGTISVDEDDDLDIMLVEEGPPKGTNILRVLMKQNSVAIKRCEELVVEHHITPIWTVNGKPYYSPEQGEIVRKLYFDDVLVKRKDRQQFWKQYKDDRMKEGKFTEHQNSPWARGYRKRARTAPEGYMTQREVIDMLHIQYKDIQARFKSGRLKYLEKDGQRFIKKEDAIEYGEYRKTRKENTIESKKEA